MIGPISIPQTSSIIVIPMTQTKTPTTRLNQVVIAGVIQELSLRTLSKGLVRFARALKMVNMTIIFTKFVATMSREPLSGKYDVIRYSPNATGIRPNGPLRDSIISSSKSVSDFSVKLAILSKT